MQSKETVMLMNEGGSCLARLRLSALSLAISGAFLMAPTWAQDQAETNDDASRDRVEDTITVTAERGRERMAMDTPQSVNTITREDLDEQVPVDLTQALQREPSVGLGPAGQSLSFWQQGFSIRGLGAQRVLTLTHRTSPRP